MNINLTSINYENSQYLHVESKAKDMKTSFDNAIEIFQQLHDTKQVLPFYPVFQIHQQDLKSTCCISIGIMMKNAISRVVVVWKDGSRKRILTSFRIQLCYLI